MKSRLWVGLFAAISLALPGWAQPAPPPDNEAVPAPETQVAASPPANISPGAAEVIKLAGSGVTEDVVLAYVNNSQYQFNLSAEDVVYMKDLGVPSTVITAMINHDSTIASQARATAQVPPPQPPPPSSRAVEAPLTPQETVSEPPPTDVSYFYNDLAPYGSWVVVSGVGWCWQPRAVAISHGWRPYCDGGHWVNSDCGWYWASDYSWGWAPFHYGRWYLHPHSGWVWSPDRVWGPAWVTWRTGGDTCGWAPLPPRAVFDVHHGWHYNGLTVGAGYDFGLRADHFTFIGVHDFTHHDLAHRALAPVQARNVFRQTTVVNNTTVVQNNVIVNRGVPVERVAAVTHTQIPRAHIADVPAGVRQGSVSAPRAAGGTPVVYRHDLPAAPQPVHPVAQKIDDRHPVVRQNPLPPVSTRPVTPASGRTYTSGTAPRATTQGGGSHTAPAVAPNTPRTTAPGAPIAPKGSGTPSTTTAPKNGAATGPSTQQPAPTAPAYGPRTAPQAPASTPRAPAAPRSAIESHPSHTVQANHAATPPVKTAPLVETPKAPKTAASEPPKSPAAYQAPKHVADSPSSRNMDLGRTHSTPAPGKTAPLTPYSSSSEHSATSVHAPPTVDTRGANPHAYYPKTMPPAASQHYSAPKSAPAAPSVPSVPAARAPVASAPTGKGDAAFGSSKKDRY